MEKLVWDFGYTKKRAQDGIVHQDCERGSQLELLLWGCRFCMASSEPLCPPRPCWCQWMPRSCQGAAAQGSCHHPCPALRHQTQLPRRDPVLLNSIWQIALGKGIDFLPSLPPSLPSIFPDKQPVAQVLLVTDAL